MSNAELLSLMANEIATLRELVDTGCLLLGDEVEAVVAHLDRVFESLLDNTEIMKDVTPPFVDRLRRK
jgi:hypothetical protein